MNHPAAGATTLRKPLPAALLDALRGEGVGACRRVAYPWACLQLKYRAKHRVVLLCHPCVFARET